MTSAPHPTLDPDDLLYDPRPAEVSVEDRQAFEAASSRLRQALQHASSGMGVDDVADARQALRSIAVKLRDAGFWRSDKHGMRDTVSLLWEADRYVNDKALLGSDRGTTHN